MGEEKKHVSTLNRTVSSPCEIALSQKVHTCLSCVFARANLAMSVATPGTRRNFGRANTSSGCCVNTLNFTTVAIVEAAAMPVVGLHSLHHDESVCQRCGVFGAVGGDGTSVLGGRRRRLRRGGVRVPSHRQGFGNPSLAVRDQLQADGRRECSGGPRRSRFPVDVRAVGVVLVGWLEP